MDRFYCSLEYILHIVHDNNVNMVMLLRSCRIHFRNKQVTKILKEVIFENMTAPTSRTFEVMMIEPFVGLYMYRSVGRYSIGFYII